jgi:hypothetical protein
MSEGAATGTAVGDISASGIFVIQVFDESTEMPDEPSDYPPPAPIPNPPLED